MSAYHFFNATNKERMSLIDITTNKEEGDPIARAMGHERRTTSYRNTDEANGQKRKYPGNHCPFCGEGVEANFDFCPKCGKDI